ncbi:MAG: hypothetical protein DRQ55_03470 [Planctomycetota bacterium]|nr:MAG: hypothetical protein DRQ55_03470 [Planctomycetota bacterium]
MNPALSIDLSDGHAPALEQALAALRRGELVVLPTETVYGLAGRLEQERVLSAAKGARRGPFAVAVPDREVAEALVGPLPGTAARAAERWWPGPMTLVVLTLGDDPVGLRVPGHVFVRELLQALGEPLLLTSANASGESPPRELCQLSDSIRATAGLIVDGGPCALGEASTVLACGYGAARVLRDGVVHRDELAQRVCGEVLVACSGNTCRSPMAAALLERELARAAAADSQLLIPRVASAGLMAGPGNPASDAAQEALRERGLELAGHSSTAVDAERIAQADVLLGMTQTHVALLAEACAGSGQRVELFDPAGHEVDDPFGAPLSHYRRCATMLADMATRRAASLCAAP